MLDYFAEIYSGTKSLAAGLAVTLKHCFRKPITLQYPEQRADLPLRSRGRLALPVDPATRENRCTACMLCVKACPNGSIVITKAAGEDGRPKPRAAKYIYKSGNCMYCGLCVEACPFAALVMTEEYETAAENRAGLDLDLAAERYELKGGKLPWWLGKFKSEAQA